MPHRRTAAAVMAAAILVAGCPRDDARDLDVDAPAEDDRTQEVGPGGDEPLTDPGRVEDAEPASWDHRSRSPR